MSILKAVSDILLASNVNSTVSDRIFTSSAFTTTTMPYIVLQAQMEQNSYTKDKDSTVDTYLTEVFIYHNTIAEAVTLGNLCRTALQGYSGTINGIGIDGCHLRAEEDDEGEIDGQFIPIWSQEYQIRMKR
jgi:Na+-translocating ferredoxin:NAD+ oxidoreductase RnfG subunit